MLAGSTVAAPRGLQQRMMGRVVVGLSNDLVGIVLVPPVGRACNDQHRQHERHGANEQTSAPETAQNQGFTLDPVPEPVKADLSKRS